MVIRPGNSNRVSPFAYLVDCIDNIFPESGVKSVNYNKLENQCEGFVYNKKKSVRSNIPLFFLIELRKYLNFLKEFEQQIRKRQSHSRYLQEKLNNASNQVLIAANILENKVPFVLRRKIRDLFRETIKQYIFRSKLIKQFYEKKRGYPGDYLMFERLYNNCPVSNGIGYYFDKYVLMNSLTRAVINRKDAIKRILRSIDESARTPIINILNLGCGSSREIKELLREKPFKSKMHFTLVDQDDGALRFSEKSLAAFRDKERIDLKYKKRNIAKMIGFEERRGIKEKILCEDVIYSLGVVDYFMENVFWKFIKFSYGQLSANGKLVIASCSPNNMESYVALRWFCEWNFYVRNTKEVKKLVQKSLDVNSVDIIWERERQIFFVIITKRESC